MATGEYSVYRSLQVDSAVKAAAWPTSWRLPGADRISPRWPNVNTRIWLRRRWYVENHQKKSVKKC